MYTHPYIYVQTPKHDTSIEKADAKKLAKVMKKKKVIKKGPKGRKVIKKGVIKKVKVEAQSPKRALLRRPSAARPEEAEEGVPVLRDWKRMQWLAKQKEKGTLNKQFVEQLVEVEKAGRSETTLFVNTCVVRDPKGSWKVDMDNMVFKDW